MCFNNTYEITKCLVVSARTCATGFNPGGVCEGPLFAPQFTSARIRSRFDLVELGGDKCFYYKGSSNRKLNDSNWHYRLVHALYAREPYIFTRI